MMRPDENAINAVMNGWLDGADHIYPMTVQFEDTDAIGIVYHSNYINYAERARTALLRCIDVDMQGLIERDEGIIIRKIGVEYKSPSYIGERLMVTSTNFNLGKATLNMTQIVSDDDGKVRAILDVQGAFVSSGRPIRIPADVREKMEAAMATTATAS
ncbi:MAG: acyl-CoA thioesterase [Alphaproteobacteria bacterium]|nr:acyl-CoA thioesterase [Alphaproteobacteria bacterium]